MKPGTLYGIGVGPGDPELVTVKGASILAATRRVFVPKPREDGESLALGIAERYLRKDAEVVELVFPMSTESHIITSRWKESAKRVAAVLRTPENACFLSLGDPLLYSTWVYLRRALCALLPEAATETIPGVTAVAAAAALVELPLGEGKTPVTIIPAADDLSVVRQALAAGGMVALMKVGRRLPDVLAVLAECGALDRARLVSRAGLDGQRVETNLRGLENESPEAGYLSVVLVPPPGEESS